jgi:membrane-bound ClpP family serine protease
VKNIKDYLIVLASLLDDVLIIGVVLVILWALHVPISPPVSVFLAILFIVLTFITSRFLVPAYRRRKTTGAEGLVGLRGCVIEALEPEGVVKICNEYWKAISVEGKVQSGDIVEVISVSGLRLQVRCIERKGSESDR